MKSLFRHDEVERLKYSVGQIREANARLRERLAEARQEAAYPVRLVGHPRDAQHEIDRLRRALAAMQERLDAAEEWRRATAEGQPAMVRLGWRVS